MLLSHPAPLEAVVDQTHQTALVTRVVMRMPKRLVLLANRPPSPPSSRVEMEATVDFWGVLAALQRSQVAGLVQRFSEARQPAALSPCQVPRLAATAAAI